MNTFQIRLGVVSDAAQLAQFAARAFAETFGKDNRPEDLQAHLTHSYGVEQQSKELADPNTMTLLVHHGDDLVGYAQIRHKTPPACVVHQQPMELHRFYIDKSAQGSGLAKTLMDAVKTMAHEAQAMHLWLCVWERNPRAIAFYTKVGFIDVGSTDFYVGPDCQTDRVLVANVDVAHSSSLCQ
jgi:diamine N-acetyltransferase